MGNRIRMYIAWLIFGLVIILMRIFLFLCYFIGGIIVGVKTAITNKKY
jgi:hypothetical protein